MKMKEIREKDTSHLEHELVDARKHLFELRTQAVTEKLEDPTQIGKTRKTIARLKTVLHQRKLEEAKKAKEPAAV
jgi:large subunit ribosomal protein L29